MVGADSDSNHFEVSFNFHEAKQSKTVSSELVSRDPFFQPAFRVGVVRHVDNKFFLPVLFP